MLNVGLDVEMAVPTDVHTDESQWVEFCSRWKEQISELLKRSGGSFDITGAPNYAEYRAAWQRRWARRGEPWRMEPEFDVDWDYWSRRKDIPIDENLGRYPFSERGPMPLNELLSRAIVERLLSEHAGGKWLTESSSSGDRRVTSEGLDLRGANLANADLSLLPLFSTRGSLGRLAWDKADTDAKEQGSVNLRGANLWRSDLRRSSLRSAHLENARLMSAHLEGASLEGAHLEGADLRRVHFDESTNIKDVSFGREGKGFAIMADIRWGGVDISTLNWEHVTQLGDDDLAFETLKRNELTGALTDQEKDIKSRLADYTAAVRANRQVASELRRRGLDGIATRFSYRAQVLHRKQLGQEMWHDSRASASEKFRLLLAWLFSFSLAGVVGYGYRLKRTASVYLGVVAVFMLLYHQISIPGSETLSWRGALNVSLTSFHGRGVFPGFAFGSAPGVGSAFAFVSAAEGALGLLLEAIFIAAFTQRLLSR